MRKIWRQIGPPRTYIKIRAERKAGEFLSQLNPRPEGRPQKLSMRGEFSKADAIKDAGITEQDAARWQQIAEVLDSEEIPSAGEINTWLNPRMEIASLPATTGNPKIIFPCVEV